MIMLILHGCGKNQSITIAEVEPLPIERLDQFILDFNNDSIEKNEETLSIEDYITAWQPGIGLYLSMMGMDSVSRLAAIQELQSGQVYTVFGPDVQQRLGTLEDTEIQLGKIEKRLGELLPDASIKHIYGILTPYRQSVVISDTVAMIGLNHYLGEDYPGYGGMPVYQRALKVKGRIPIDLTEAIVRIDYPYTPTTGSLIERMLYEGTVIEAVSLITDRSVNDIFGFDDEEFKLMDINESQLWQWLASNNLLYSTKNADINRFVEQAPTTTGYSPTLPGRAGSYIGQKIINSYLANNDSAILSDLFEPSFYGNPQNVLIKAKYNPISQN